MTEKFASKIMDSAAVRLLDQIGILIFFENPVLFQMQLQERERVKQMTLDIHERQEEEDYQGKRF